MYTALSGLTLPLSRLNVGALAIGFGATTHILWETVERGVMKLGTSDLNLTYENTIYDLVFSFLGTVTGMVLMVTVLWPRRHLLAEGLF